MTPMPFVEDILMIVIDAGVGTPENVSNKCLSTASDQFVDK